MGDVIEFRPRTPQPSEVSLEDIAQQMVEALGELRTVTGGDGRWDHLACMRIARALDQFIGGADASHSITLPRGFTPEQRAQVEEILQGVLDEQIKRDRRFAVGIVQKGMMALTLDLTGAQLPPDYPSYASDE